MRLAKDEQKKIKQAFLECFGDGSVYLFGSRVDDTQRGGDIDLYLVPDEKDDNLRDKKRAFLVKQDHYIGEQKIDAVIAKDKNRLIEKEAIKNGIAL